MAKIKTTWESWFSGRESHKKRNISEVAIEKKVSNNSGTNVSVFTKTTNPNIVVLSEKMDNTHNYVQNTNRHRILKSACLIIMGIIILITFFLFLKTYNRVNELYQLFT